MLSMEWSSIVVNNIKEKVNHNCSLRCKKAGEIRLRIDTALKLLTDLFCTLGSYEDLAVHNSFTVEQFCFEFLGLL